MARAKGQVREGLRYVWATADLRSPLISMAIVGVFAFNFTITLPLLAKFTFHGGAGLYSSFLAAMGAGAVSGACSPPTAAGRRNAPGRDRHGLRGADPAVSLAPTKTVAIILLVPMGAASISFIATNNATLQLRADPAMRGRVMSLNAIAFLGQHPDRRALARVHQRRHQPAGGPGGRRRGHLAGQRPAFLPGQRQREARASMTCVPSSPLADRRRRADALVRGRRPGARRQSGRPMAEDWTLLPRPAAGRLVRRRRRTLRPGPPAVSRRARSTRSWPPRPHDGARRGVRHRHRRPAVHRPRAATCSGWSPTNAWRRWPAGAVCPSRRGRSRSGIRVTAASTS